MRHTSLTFALVGLFAVAVRATVLVPADLSELSREAHAIVRGQVVSVDARWTEDRRGIDTIVTLEAERYLKGQLGGMVQFRVPGGTLGRIRNVVVGAPRFDVGQRVIVFLGATGPRVPYLLGLSQGVFRVDVSGSGDALVSPPPHMPGVAGPIVRGSTESRPAPLDAFERDVRALVEVRR